MNIEPLELIVDNKKIKGKLFKPAGNSKKLALLFLHGWTGKPNEGAARELAEKGFYCLTFSYSGHNDSEGRIEDVTRQGSLKECIAAYDYLKNHIPEDCGIGVAGNSYGGYQAAMLSAERPVSCISLRVPAPYPDEGFDQPRIRNGPEDAKVLEWRNTPIDWEGNKAFTAIHNFGGGIQIIEAENDALVPAQAVQNYVSAVSDKSKLDYVLMKNWPHSLGDSRERQQQFVGLILNWALKQEKRV